MRFLQKPLFETLLSFILKGKWNRATMSPNYNVKAVRKLKIALFSGELTSGIVLAENNLVSISKTMFLGQIILKRIHLILKTEALMLTFPFG